MYVYKPVYVYIYICIMYICSIIYLYTRVGWVCIYVCECSYLCIKYVLCTYVYMYLCVCVMLACMYVCMFVYVYRFAYVYMLVGYLCLEIRRLFVDCWVLRKEKQYSVAKKACIASVRREVSNVHLSLFNVSVIIMTHDVWNNFNIYI
jgi:hypothetical protein